MKTKTLRYAIPLIAVAVLLAVVAAYKIKSPSPSSSSSSSSPSKDNRRPLRLGYSTWIACYPLIIAKEKGFFAQQGVDVELFFKPNYNDLLPDFAAGTLDGLDYAPDGPLRFPKSSPVKVVLWVGDCSGCDSVVAQSSFKSVADLKGHKVGIHIGSFGEIFIDEMMRQNNLTVGDIQLVNVDEGGVPLQLQNDTIQAGHTWEPYTTQALKNGGHVVFSNKQAPGLTSDIMMFHETTLAERPDDVRAFMRAWFQTVAYWDANPKEGNEIVGIALKTPPSEIQDTRSAYQFFSLEEVKRRNALGNDPASLSSLINKHADFLIRTGALGHRPNIDALMTAEFLPSAAPP